MKDHSIKIEKNIPIPPHGNEKKTAPFLEMEVGDSVLVKNRAESNRIFTLMKRSKKKALTRQVEGGIRVWRIA